eukprot:scaffold140736_cov17-Tisochrysis_lutea.AAC.1
MIQAGRAENGVCISGSQHGHHDNSLQISVWRRRTAEGKVKRDKQTDNNFQKRLLHCNVRWGCIRRSKNSM